MPRRAEKNGCSIIIYAAAAFYSFIKSLISGKMDFKARMIPLLFLAEDANYQQVFSIRDIQQIMIDALEENADKRQIEDVFSRRADWFEKVNQNPRKYKLLDIAKDYARNVLNE